MSDSKKPDKIRRNLVVATSVYFSHRGTLNYL